MLAGLILFRTGDFVTIDVSRMVFKGDILGGARHSLGGPLCKRYYCTV